jgi:3-oxoadipate enol-lactonase
MVSGDRERAIRTAWELNVSPGFAENADAYAVFRTNGLKRAVALPVVRAQAQAIFAHDTLARVPRLSMPTLVVHGTADQVVPLENGRLIAGQIAASRLEILEDVGHLFFWERPERSAELLREHAAVSA